MLKQQQKKPVNRGRSQMWLPLETGSMGELFSF